jgi:hypothetical protein
MPGATLTDAAFIAGFLEGRSASNEDILPKKDSRLLILPAAEYWALSTGDEWQSRVLSQFVLGADKTTDLTGQIDDVLNWLVARDVRIENPADIRSHLLRYSDLLLVIPTIWKKAVGLLAPSTQFSLTLYRDPEIQDEYLTLYARQEKYEKGILDLLHIINIECEDLLSNFSGWFLTTTDFRSPK